MLSTVLSKCMFVNTSIVIFLSFFHKPEAYDAKSLFLYSDMDLLGWLAVSKRSVSDTKEEYLYMLTH